MASNIQIGDRVYVCRSRLPSVNDQTKAFYETTVQDRRDRSVSVRLPDGTNSDFVATKFVHHRVGVTVIAFGDFHSESTLIDPLAKTVLQYSRLLFGDDEYVRFLKIRTEAELDLLCRTNQFIPFDHIALLGHGAKDGALCGALGNIPVSRLVEIFELNNPVPWDFTFLCCYLGRNAFGKAFSRSAACKSMVAPYNAVHGAVSAQFIQTYLVKLLLEGETTAVAHRHASESAPPKSKFRLWRNGNHDG
mgnify:CR=1 FL=1|jgi:hypothetical protein